MRNEVFKPLSVVRYEFMESLTNLINNSMLPPFVTEAILKDACNEMRILSQRQLEIDKKEYQKALNNANEQKDN